MAEIVDAAHAVLAKMEERRDSHSWPPHLREGFREVLAALISHAEQLKGMAKMQWQDLMRQPSSKDPDVNYARQVAVRVLTAVLSDQELEKMDEFKTLSRRVVEAAEFVAIKERKRAEAAEAERDDLRDALKKEKFRSSAMRENFHGESDRANENHQAKQAAEDEVERLKGALVEVDDVKLLCVKILAANEPGETTEGARYLAADVLGRLTGKKASDLLNAALSDSPAHVEVTILRGNRVEYPDVTLADLATPPTKEGADG